MAKELYGGNDYSLVLICGGVDVMEAVRTVRRLSMVPILVMKKRYDGAEKIEALENGADEYIQYPARREEGIASAGIDQEIHGMESLLWPHWMSACSRGALHIA